MAIRHTIALCTLVCALATTSAATTAGRGDGQASGSGTASAAHLSIAGDVPRPLTLMAADLKGMPRTTVIVQEGGQPVVYEGVLVGELIGRAGAPLGRDLTGKALATYVRASASDGYEVVFSLAELDPAMSESSVIVADTVAGKPLVAPQGPLRIVAPQDKRAARSVRMLIALDVVRLRK